MLEDGEREKLERHPVDKCQVRAKASAQHRAKMASKASRDGKALRHDADSLQLETVAGTGIAHLHVVKSIQEHA